MSENLENNKEKIEKPKRTLTQAQLDNLEKMRKKKLLKSEARKMIEAQSKQNETNILKIPNSLPPNNSIKDYSNDIEDLKREINFISGYIKEKQNRKQIQYILALVHKLVFFVDYVLIAVEFVFYFVFL